MALVYEQVSFSYDPTGPVVLNGIDLVLDQGTFLGIAGHTGSGKSTLLRLSNGLLAPTRGRVLIDGTALSQKRHKDAVAQRNVGLVFQFPEHQLFGATVAEDIMFGPLNQGLPEDQARALAEEALEQVGLSWDGFKEASPFGLSGGEQRRIALAGVLAMRPRYLVMDEPLVGLDPATRREFAALLHDLKGSGIASMMASHSMEDLAALCDRILVLNRGRICLEGTPDVVFSQPEALEEAGLDLPRAAHVALDLEKRGVPFDGLPVTENELIAQLQRLLM